MLFAVIDIGSNSVRLMLSNGEKTLYKESRITRLAKNMGKNKILDINSVELTLSAVSFFVEYAKKRGAEKIFAFATAAVRTATNSSFFVSEFKKRFSFDLDVVSGENEALFGLNGAVQGDSGGVIDIGGASTEVIVKINNKVEYKKSLPYGCVVVTDRCGQNKIAVQNFTDELVKDYGEVPHSDFYCIGGTGTSIASVLQSLKVYSSEVVHGYKIRLENLMDLRDKFFALPVSDRKNITGLQVGREEVIGSGICILISVMKYIGIDEVTVSENDNLEGYLKGKLSDDK